MMRRTLFLVIALGVAGAATLAMPGSAFAHALRVSSSPDDGATLSQAPSSVSITFTEPPDVNLSRISVLDTSSKQYQTESLQVAAGNSSELQVSLAPLPKGVY